MFVPGQYREREHRYLTKKITNIMWKLFLINKSLKSSHVSLITCIVLNQLKSYSSATNMKAVQFEVGGPEKLYVGDVPEPTLRNKEVLIKVYATAINRADMLQRLGKYPSPAGESDILGLEASGFVEKMHESCSGRWNIGDRVMALLPGGGNAEYVAAYEDHLLPIDKDMSFVEAAAIPEVWLTAYQLIHFVGKFERGDSVLIHAGGSGVGTAATQLVTTAQGKAYVTAGSLEKIETAKSLGAVNGFNYKKGDFSEALLKNTDGAGVNIILDCIGADFWEQNLKSIGLEGKWVQYGLLSGGKVNGDILSLILRKRVTLVGSTLRTRSKQYKKELVESFSKNALPHFKTKSLKTIIHSVLPGLESIGEAHKMMQSNVNTGKIVLKVREEHSREEL